LTRKGAKHNPGMNSGDTISDIPDGIGYSYRLEIFVLMTPGINSGVTISVIPTVLGILMDWKLLC
jgi:hypothetical protein